MLRVYKGLSLPTSGLVQNGGPSRDDVSMYNVRCRHEMYLQIGKGMALPCLFTLTNEVRPDHCPKSPPLIHTQYIVNIDVAINTALDQQKVTQSKGGWAGQPFIETHLIGGPTPLVCRAQGGDNRGDDELHCIQRGRKPGPQRDFCRLFLWNCDVTLHMALPQRKRQGHHAGGLPHSILRMRAALVHLSGL